MAGLFAAPRDHRRYVDVGKLPAILATDRPVTATKKAKLLLRATRCSGHRSSWWVKAAWSIDERAQISIALALLLMWSLFDAPRQDLAIVEAEFELSSAATYLLPNKFKAQPIT